MIKCKYLGKTEYYNKTKYEPMYLRQGEVYNIIYANNEPNYYVVFIVDNFEKVINFIPYSVNPFINYWKIL